MKKPGNIKIAFSLFKLVDSLLWAMLAAILLGTLGFFAAIGVNVFGALALAKILGLQSSLSYPALFALILGCGLGRGVLRYLEQYLNHYLAFSLLARLRDKVFEALRRLAPAKLLDQQQGDLLAVLTADIEALEVFYAHTLSPVAIALCVCAGVLVLQSIVAGTLMTLLLTGGFITIGILLPYLGSKVLFATAIEYRKHFAAFNAFLLDSIKGVREIILHQAGAKRKEEMSRRTGQLLSSSHQLSQKNGFLSALTQIILTGFYVFALWLAIKQYQSGLLSVGSVVLSLVIYYSSFGPVLALSALPGNLSQTFAAARRVLALLAQKPLVEPVVNGQDFAFKSLTVSDLTFGYQEHRVLDGINLTLAKGEILGLQGQSGCGKSTLLKLLLRFYQKQGGEIRYNGIEIEEINTSSLFENVSLFTQHTTLLNDTIANNLRLAKPDASEEEMEAACRKAAIHDFILSLDSRYESQVGLLGDRLSQGERQRIGLAQIFLRNTPVILLDEPTSNLDGLNEGIILKALVKEKANHAMILVSHKASTLKIADRIALLDGTGQLAL